MKHILLLASAAILGLCGPAAAQIGPPNQIQCNTPTNASAAGAGTTSILNNVAGRTIFICGWHVTVPTTATTFQFGYSTVAACASGVTTFTPALNVSSTAPSADHIDYAVFNIPAGNNLCLVAGGLINAVVWTGQF